MKVYKGISSFINYLKNEGEVLFVNKKVDTNLEISEIVDRLSKSGDGGKAIVFTNNGTNFPIALNLLGSQKRISNALYSDNLLSLEKEVQEILKLITKPSSGIINGFKTLLKIKSIIPQKLKRKGSCHTNFLGNNINVLPIIKCWPEDGGRFITLPLVHTKDIETGITNVGMYRMQVLDETSTGMHWHLHKTGANIFKKYKARNMIMPVTVTLGGDPSYTYSATAPLPEGISEYMLAGMIRKKRVKLVKSITNDIYIPEDSDFVIEGFIDPNEDFCLEGPFGDHTGYYSLEDYYPRFHIKKIYSRNNAVYPATLVGVPPQEDAYIALATERIFFNILKGTVLPELIDMRVPDIGGGHNLVLVKVENKFKGESQKVMHALWGLGQMMFNKVLIIFGPNDDLDDLNILFKSLFKRIDIEKDIYFSKGPMDILDHASSSFAFGGKMAIDCSSDIKRDEGIEEILPPNLKNILIVDSFLKMGVPVVLLKYDKENSIKDLILIIEEESRSDIKMYFVSDSISEGCDIYYSLWMLLSNFDPHKDTEIIRDSDGKIVSFLFDCRSNKYVYSMEKTLWPKLALMNNETIEKVDSNWDDYNIGDFISSPTLRLKKFFVT